MDITYEEVLKLNDLNGFEPEQVEFTLGLIFETARERHNSEDIKTGLEFSKKQNLENFDDQDKMVFHYNIANGWSYLQKIIKDNNSRESWNFELEEQIINLRLSLIYSENTDDDFNKCQILMRINS